jgi:hypothetical protein
MVFVGASAGGWAALFFQGLFFHQAQVCAFSPQAFLDRATREEEGDERWAPYVNHLNKSLVVAKETGDTAISSSSSSSSPLDHPPLLLSIRNHAVWSKKRGGGTEEQDERESSNSSSGTSCDKNGKKNNFVHARNRRSRYSHHYGASEVHYNIHHHLDARHAMHLRRVETVVELVRGGRERRGGVGHDRKRGEEEGEKEGGAEEAAEEEEEHELEEDDDDNALTEDTLPRITCVPHDGPQGDGAHALAKHLRDNGELSLILNDLLLIDDDDEDDYDDEAKKDNDDSSLFTSDHWEDGGDDGGSKSGGDNGDPPIVDYVSFVQESGDEEDEDGEFLVPRFDLDQLYSALGCPSLLGCNPSQQQRKKCQQKVQGQPPHHEVILAARHAMTRTGFFFLRPSSRRSTNPQLTPSSSSSSSSCSSCSCRRHDLLQTLPKVAAAAASAPAAATYVGSASASEEQAAGLASTVDTTSTSNATTAATPTAVPAPAASFEVIARAYQACEDMADAPNEFKMGNQGIDMAVQQDDGGECGRGARERERGGRERAAGGVWSSEHAKEQGLLGGWRRGDNDLLRCDSFRCAVEVPSPCCEQQTPQAEGDDDDIDPPPPPAAAAAAPTADVSPAPAPVPLAAPAAPPSAAAAPGSKRHLWPSDQNLPNFTNSIHGYAQALTDHVTPTLLAMFEHALCLPRDYLLARCSTGNTLSYLTTRTYPVPSAPSSLRPPAVPLPTSSSSSSLHAPSSSPAATPTPTPLAPVTGAAAEAAEAAPAAGHMRMHTDSEFLTILHFNEPGLEVFDTRRRPMAPPLWRRLPSSPNVGGCFVVIFDDAFEVLTNGAVPATLHRVRCEEQQEQKQEQQPQREDGQQQQQQQQQQQLLATITASASIEGASVRRKRRTSLVMFVGLDELVEPPEAFAEKQNRRRSSKQLKEWWVRAEAVSGALI